MPRLFILLLLFCLPLSLPCYALAQPGNELAKQYDARATTPGLALSNITQQEAPGTQQQGNVIPLQLAQQQFQQPTEVPASSEGFNLDATADKTGKSIQQQQLLILTIKVWARAWSNKDVNNYVNAYTRNYKGRKRNHHDWVEHIRSRFQQPGKIEVNLSNIYIKSRNAQRAIIDFEQAYKSPAYGDNIIKRIILAKQDNDWKISEERTLSVL